MIKKLDEAALDALLMNGVADDVIDMVLAAIAGEADLDALLAGGPTAPRPDSTTARVAPSGAFLSQLKVQGFRGVGNQTVLRLPPGPGLTVISGRNGSGKSSLSEALECALTKTTARWDRTLGHAEFRAGWRNLHAGDPCEINVTIHQEGQQPATVRVSWPSGATDPRDADWTYQVAGKPRESTDLGWTAAIQSYRPMLSYDDLGVLLMAKPSELHDSIARALDLNALTAAVESLRVRVAPLKAPLRQAGTERKRLRADLEAVDDDRAREARRLLARTAPDLGALSDLAAGTAGQSGPLRTCERILAIQVPRIEAATSAGDELDAARAALAAVGERRSRSSELRDRLLAEALQFHEVLGDTECPVCGTGSLNADWRDRTKAALAEDDLLRQARGEAERRHGRAEDEIRRLLVAAPPVVTQEEVDLPSQHAVAEAWGMWNSATVTSGSHLVELHGALLAAITAWQSETRAQAEALSQTWSPFAVRIDRLVQDFTDALKQDAQAVTLDAAHTAATAAAHNLRAARLDPIVNRTREIWSQLRQESNVSLQDIELTGKGNRRSVDIKAVVDDTAGTSALAVMSQGELNSLALALYLPRATSDDSPFRFLVLDDPVQAMDPTKVDGLAAVLADVAKTRQVIVFSHDDRFTQAARRLPIPPTVLSARRGARSEVIIQNELRPVERYLSDAYAVIQERELDDSIRRRVIPGILRQAIESAAWQRYATDGLAAGDSLSELETKWQQAARLRARLALILEPGFEGWLSRETRRRRIVGICNAGTHQPMTGDVREAYEDAKSVISAIENKRR